MARYSILSKPVLFTLPVLTALIASAIPAPAQSGPEPAKPPLMVPFRPLMPITDGWKQDGVLINQSIAATGPDSWLSTCTYVDKSNTFTLTPSTTLLRVIRRQGQSFPPIALTDANVYQGAVQTVAGQDGAWAVWSSPEGLKAWWVSGMSGKPVGAPLLLPGTAGIREFKTAGNRDATWIVYNNYIAWNAAIVSSNTETSSPILRGTWVVQSEPTPSASVAVAANDNALVFVQSALPIKEPSTRVVSTFGIVSPSMAWTGRVIGGSDRLLGVLSYGSGWLVIYSAQVTPLVGGSLVMGQELAAQGGPVPEPAQALFIEPPSYARVQVISDVNIGALLVTNPPISGVYSSFAMILQKGVDAKVIGENVILRQGNTLTTPSAAALRGNFLSIQAPIWSETANTDFELALTSYHISTPSPATSLSVISSYGVQEEPALAWLPDAALVAWQQISTALEGPAIRFRQYRSGSTAPDLIVSNTGFSRLSSPDLAINGNRVLMVARQPTEYTPPGDEEDVAGILIENGQAITEIFPIGSGPGSQRAACVAPHPDGFCVVWREVLELTNNETLYRIRMSVLDRNGIASIPGGTTLATSNTELSSPCVATRDNMIAVVWKRQTATGTRVEAGLTNGANPVTPMDVFPSLPGTSSPDVIRIDDHFIVTARQQGGTGDNDIVASLVVPNNSPIVRPPPRRAW